MRGVQSKKSPLDREVVIGDDRVAVSRVDKAIAVALSAITTVWLVAYTLVFEWAFLR